MATVELHKETRAMMTALMGVYKTQDVGTVFRRAYEECVGGSDGGACRIDCRLYLSGEPNLPAYLIRACMEHGISVPA